MTELCMCGDAKSSHENGTGECKVCSWNPCVPGPEGHCQSFRPVQKRIDMTDFQFDDIRRVMTVNGVSYAYELFDEFGISGMANGQKFEVQRDEAGNLSIKRLD